MSRVGRGRTPCAVAASLGEDRHEVHVDPLIVEAQRITASAFVDGVDLRDVQIAARHADPRTTMRYDRARNNLDRHPNYILAAFMASGT